MTLRNLPLDCSLMIQEENASGRSDDAAPASRPNRQITMIGQQLDSRQIFLDGREVEIVHDQKIYRLRLTAQNKLILTK